MAEPQRTRGPHAPVNPPSSVVNRGVRRTALRTYLGTIILFFVGVGVALVYWATRQPRPVDDVSREIPRAEGTAGERTDGGRNPDPKPASPRDEVEYRAGSVITRVDQIFEDGGRDTVGRRVELETVKVERVESPTLFWIDAEGRRLAIVGAHSDVQAGQTVKIVGAVERFGDALRIRASRVEAASGT
jgi:hypothetical protein